MKAFIFDLDGVICGTDEYHYLAWKQLATEYGIYFDRDINQKLRGVSRIESLEILLKNSTKTYTQAEKLAMAESKNTVYNILLNNITEKDRFDGVTETLEELRKQGYLLAIGSSSKNAKFILERLGYKDYFDAVSDGTNISKSKPDPEVFLKAAEMLKLSPKDCYIVEDATAGIEAGTAGGFTTIGIGPASKYEKTNYPIKTFTDLLKIVK